MPQERTRVFALARELDMESKDLLNLCRDHGIDVKNQLSTLDPEVCDQIVQLVQRVQRGGAAAAPAAPSKPAPLPTPQPARMPNLQSRPAPPPQTTPAPVPPVVAPQREAPAASTPTPAPPPQPKRPVEAPPTPAPEVPAVRVAEPTATSPAATPVASGPEEATRLPEKKTAPKQAPAAKGTPPGPSEAAAQPPVAPPQPPAPRQTPVPAAPAATRPAPVSPPPAVPPVTPQPTAPAAARPSQVPAPPAPPTTHPGVPTLPLQNRPSAAPGMRNLDQQRSRTPGGGSPPRDGGGGNAPGSSGGPGGERRPTRPPPHIRSGRPGPGRSLAPPPPQRGLAVPQAPQPPKPAPAGPRKIADLPPEMLAPGGDSNQMIQKALKQQQEAQQPAKHAAPVTAPAAPVLDDSDDDGDRKGAKPGSKRGPGGAGGVVGRDARHKERSVRQAGRKVEIKGGRVALVEEDERHRGRRPKKHVKALPTQPRKGKVPIQTPITVRALGEAIGVRSSDLVGKLMMVHGLTNITINSTLDEVLAETVALEYNCELDVKRQADAEADLHVTLGVPDKPEDLLPRAPIVTIMGHVDHGKTSLLDKIRKSNVVATEAGGITQVIRAWRVEHGGHPVTFLDTPGHEAFTKMRARGANVTDIAVIVVAADDGVKPQTEEAISHAKAAGVSIVVAINKVDMPTANIRKTEQQLYGLDLLPDNMGGDVPFVHTSAATGKGIDELLETLSVVAELKELKANPNKPASGTCLEAYLDEGEGVFATLLVREGTLRRGDIILCGASYGRVRAMYNDHGKPLDEAGPSVPVRITGLDDVPNADDPFIVAPDLSVAREISEKRKGKALEAALRPRQIIGLESLSEQKVTQLNVVLKAEARGSIEAIRKELEKLYHDEVQVRLLYAAIGGITTSDVSLALTSPSDTLVIGFNVVPDDQARALADERGIEIRQYDIIYKLTDDIRSALEGKLKPREEVVHLGRAIVRQTFKISRTGTIAGCYVTQGVIERSAKIRVIRSGVIIYPPNDRTVGLESLKRIKDDAREVREGFECGLKVAGYDDIKVDDVIEAYRVDQVQRTLA